MIDENIEVMYFGYNEATNKSIINACNPFSLFQKNLSLHSLFCNIFSIVKAQWMHNQNIERV